MRREGGRGGCLGGAFTHWIASFCLIAGIGLTAGISLTRRGTIERGTDGNRDEGKDGGREGGREGGKGGT